MTTTPNTDDVMPQKIRQILYNQLISQSIQTFCELKLPDVLQQSAHSIPAAQLAQKTQTHPAALLRLLKALKQFSLVKENSEGFALTPLGASLTSDAFASAQFSAQLINGEMGQAWRGMASTIRTGASSFQEQYGTTLFEYFEAHPERRAIFDRSQDMGLDLEIPEILEYINLHDGETLVDIGGGSGHLLTHMLEKWPNSRGLLFDLPVATDIARQRLNQRGKTDRIEIIAGDFFQALPNNGSVYLLSHVLHDWSDEDCRKILATCRKNMPDNALLIVIDLIINDDEGAQANTTGAMMDLYMLSLFGVIGGKERNESEFRALIEPSGFTVEQVKRLPSGNGIIYAYPQ
ncbi:methyltransferase [Serratia rubidaea]|uniref:methyltransferase n=1 Tax=Serratia rubidaea TaxID=61652 RepID=UPI0022B88265|nr:methyltransferase [Serratia rubidaea]WBF45729.1 methyltransferase [Serratia rubidaea]